jgi:hypothetical protein
MNIRFVTAFLDAHLQLMDGVSDKKFKKEYRVLSDFEEDAVGQWLKLAKARGETADSDDVLLRLLVELHKKVDQLTALVKNEERQLLELKINTKICKIGFDHIKLEEKRLQEGKEYYCRIEMPVFPKREMPMFVRAIDADIAQIILLHEADQRDWNAYVTSRERIEIREIKAKR